VYEALTHHSQTNSADEVLVIIGLKKFHMNFSDYYDHGFL